MLGEFQNDLEILLFLTKTLHQFHYYYLIKPRYYQWDLFKFLCNVFEEDIKKNLLSPDTSKAAGMAQLAEFVATGMDKQMHTGIILVDL